MPAIRAMTSGASLSATWDDGTTSFLTEAQVAIKVAELGRAGAASWFQAYFQAESGDIIGVFCEDTGDGFALRMENN